MKTLIALLLCSVAHAEQLTPAERETFAYQHRRPAPIAPAPIGVDNEAIRLLDTRRETHAH
jgi:hypothetical protein